MRVVLDENAIMPTRSHDQDAGLDMYTPVDFEIPAREYVKVDLGVHMAIPDGCMGKLESRSGMMSRGVVTMGGVIDCGYTGSVSVCLYNYNDYDVKFRRGDKVTQLVVQNVLYVMPEESGSLARTVRGDCGFGSTGA